MLASDGLHVLQLVPDVNDPAEVWETSLKWSLRALSLGAVAT